MSSFVRRFRTEILAAWRQRARQIQAARDLPPVALVDHIPDLLDQLVEVADELASTRAEPRPFETARHHALDRIGAGFDLASVVNELSLLRDCMLSIWMREHGGDNADALRLLDLAIDRAIGASAARYQKARERTLVGLDRISTATLASQSVDELLDRLLTVFLETTQAVDTAAILLVEDGVLRTRAAVGLDRELGGSFEVAIGEGFAGQVAARRAPMELHSAYTDPIVQSDAVRERRVRTLYGVPLVHDDELIGVAHMGSASVYELSQDDRQLFDSLAARATVGIVHQMVRQQLAASNEHATELAADRERTIATLESLLAASPVGIGFVDRELRYLRINGALARLAGRPPAAHVGRTVAEMLPAYAEPLARVLRRVLETGHSAVNVEVEVTGPTPDERRWLLVNSFPVRSRSDLVLGVGAIVLDISEPKRIEQELRVAVRSRDDLLAIVSHDLRSPLQTVQLAATLIGGQLDNGHRLRRHVDLIVRGCGRMERLIEDLLDTALIREGQIQLDVHRELADHLLREAVELQEPLATEKGITLVCRGDLGDAGVDCDRDRILQALGNLIGNALKFARSGDSITVRGELVANQVQFCVEDTGPGIAPSALPHLFEPYWSGRTRGAKSAGLGLYIVRGIVERHGGRVWADGKPGTGARFYFTLPLAR